MHPQKTLEILGKKTIVISTLTNDTRRATVALTITAAGDQLVPMVVYKGTENGTIKKRELQHHHPTCIYKTQENEWMDKRVMLHWVEDVLVSYVALIILLDSYHCHIMTLVVNVIQDQGCEVVHIPGDCTGLVQPLDIGYNKPFKTRLHASLAITATLAVITAFLNSDVAFLFSAAFFLLAAFFASISLSSFLASLINLFTDFNFVTFFFVFHTQ